MPARLTGCIEPRIFTPPLRALTVESSLGFDCIEFAEEGLGLSLLEWQKWFLIHALELLRDGTLRFRKIVLLVARQNGKTLISEVLALYFMRALGARLVLGTAQDLSTAEDIWQDTFDVASESELLAPLLTRPKLGKGSKEFGLKRAADGPQWSAYKVKAANRRGGRGSRQVKLVLLSEVREQQTWDAWGALTKTTNAVPEALILCESNAGDVSSVVLRYLRLMAHKALGDPDGINADADPSLLLDDTAGDAQAMAVQADEMLGLFEWSAPPACAVDDRSGWAQANPSMPWVVTERVLESDSKTDPEWVFRTECLCQWSDGTLEGPFPPGRWEAGRIVADDAGLPQNQLLGVPACALEVSFDRTRAGIVYGGYRADGRPQVEVVAYRGGTDWVVGWLTSKERTIRPEQVVIRASSPAMTLRHDLEQAGFQIVELPSVDFPIACGSLWDAVVGGEHDQCGPLRHTVNSALDVAAATARQMAYGSGTWAWYFKTSPVDISLLVAVTSVHWLLSRPAPATSRYEGDFYEIAFF